MNTTRNAFYFYPHFSLFRFLFLPIVTRLLLFERQTGASLSAGRGFFAATHTATQLCQLAGHLFRSCLFLLGSSFKFMLKRFKSTGFKHTQLMLTP